MIDQFIDRRAYQDVVGPGNFLTTEQIETFNRDGYLVLRRALADDEAAPLRVAAERLYAQTESEWVGAPEKQGPVFAAYVHHPVMQGAIGDLNGPSDVLLGFLYRKQRSSPVPKQWRQNGVYWDMSDAKVMAMFTAVTPITQRNGAIHVIPGSHRLGRLFHRPAPNYNLVCDTSSFREPCVVELDVGDVMLLHCLAVHCSPANQSDQPRINFELYFYNRRTRIVRDAPTAAVYEA